MFGTAVATLPLVKPVVKLPEARSSLVAHAGGRIVPREVVERIKAPAPTKTWFPVAHIDVVRAVEAQLQDAGFVVKKAAHALSHEDGRYFGTLDLASGLADGVTLSVGIRNSIDKSLPLGFCAGTRVFVCDNLSFGADLVVKRKHTKFGDDRFREAIAAAVGQLDQFQAQEQARIAFLKGCEITDRSAESVVLRAWEAKLVSHVALPLVLKEWREPRFEEFNPRTAWSLFNAFTTVFGHERKLGAQRTADVTMRLTGLVDQNMGFVSPLTQATIDALPAAEAA